MFEISGCFAYKIKILVLFICLNDSEIMEFNVSDSTTALILLTTAPAMVTTALIGDMLTTAPATGITALSDTVTR